MDRDALRQTILASWPSMKFAVKKFAECNAWQNAEVCHGTLLPKIELALIERQR